MVGAAIDFPKKNKAEQQVNEGAPSKRFVLTYQLVTPSGFKGEGGGTGGGGEKAFENATSEGNSMMEITRQIATQVSRTPYNEHMKVLMISEDVAKSPYFSKIFDFFIRGQESRRGIKVMVSKDEARKGLDIEAVAEKLPALHINSVSENQFKTARMLYITRLGDIHEKLLDNRSFTLQRIHVKDKEVKVAGAAVINGFKKQMIGWLDEEETKGLNFLRDEVTGGIVEFTINDAIAVYEIKEAKCKIRADVSNKDNIQFFVDIDSEGTLPETHADLNYLKPAVLSNMEKMVEKEIERLVKESVNKLQKEFNADILGLGEFLENEHYKVWKNIRDDWDHGKNYFSQSTIHVNAKAEIRSTGIVDETQKE